MTKAQVERWAGGRRRTGPRGTTWTIERTVNGRRYSVTLDVRSEKEALSQLYLFEADPDSFEVAKARAQPVTLTAEVAAGVLRTTSRATEASRRAFRETLAWWARQLGKTDLRKLKPIEIERMAARGGIAPGSREPTETVGPSRQQHRISALSMTYTYLQREGVLDVNPARAAKPPKPKRRPIAERAYTVTEIEDAYAALETQRYRDILRIRVTTGLHYSEIERVVSGEGKVRVVDDPNIAAVVEVMHKSGVAHQVSLDRATYEAMMRLIVMGKLPTRGNAWRAFQRVGIELARLRHTMVSVGTEQGELIYPQGKGVPLSVVAQVAGHRTGITKDAYLGAIVPPLLKMPFELTHPGDP